MDTLIRCGSNCQTFKHLAKRTFKELSTRSQPRASPENRPFLEMFRVQATQACRVNFFLKSRFPRFILSLHLQCPQFLFFPSTTSHIIMSVLPLAYLTRHTFKKFGHCVNSPTHINFLKISCIFPYELTFHISISSSE